ncbi:heparan-alpha-glucosaminide N-acetyltransferase [Roseibium litorale]|uniref:DUF1624 domain-containing protein n=1 Tax=Roseibium litorale TaxID=2803841 RepID=A0ABR9CIN4_9HYPH|nr:heparan-alpha-glucosaminide N-acetyltransferase [Roseibium litorale]MBD8890692.1 DUF1624 domain-containing protein [Roseibium litorale]
MSSRRIGALDAARGAALVAMVVYHLSWDLSWFGHVDWAVSTDPDWKAFAASIAGSFLFLSGIGLALAHRNGIRWRAFWIREGKVALAACTVSIATWFAFGDSFVRFGILHAIAASSLIALPFLRAPAFLSIAAAALIGTAPLWASSHAFDGQLLLWTGLGQPDYGSVDYVPIAPWTGLVLLGLGLTRLALRLKPALFNVRAPDETGAQQSPGRVLGALATFGRYSLPVYLIHQPLLYGLVWSFTALGLAPDRSEALFVRDCTRACVATFGDETACNTSCSCTLDAARKDGFWEDLVKSPNDSGLRARLNDAYAICLRDTPSTPPATSSGN